MFVGGGHFNQNHKKLHENFKNSVFLGKLMWGHASLWGEQAKFLSFGKIPSARLTGHVKT